MQSLHLALFDKNQCHIDKPSQLYQKRPKLGDGGENKNKNKKYRYSTDLGDLRINLKIYFRTFALILITLPVWLKKKVSNNSHIACI